MPHMKSSSFVTTIDLKLADKLLAGLKERGFDISHPPYTVFSGKDKGVSCTLYTSGKLVVQGKEMEQFIEYFLEPEILHTFNYKYAAHQFDPTPRIGIDESGKGDFFGPLCIAGVFAQGEDLAKLHEMGVQDSKNLSDATILKLGKQIRSAFPHHIVRINPKKYNELYSQFKNLNRLLAWGHATIIENLVQATECQRVVIDQFADEHVVETALKRKKLKLDLFQRHRAEEDLVVAAASILARQAFLEGLEQLGKTYGVTLPKGASAKTIAVGKELVQRHGKDILEMIAKLHFKTLDAILF